MATDSAESSKSLTGSDLIQPLESLEGENFKSSCAEDRPEVSSKPPFERGGGGGGGGGC